MVNVYKCLRCGHEWAGRLNREPKVCPGCNSPYWNKPKVKQSGPPKKYPAYEIGNGLWFASKGRAKVNQLSVDGPPKRTIRSRPDIVGQTEQNARIFIDIDRKDIKKTTVKHTVMAQNENGEWDIIHEDLKEGKAKHRTKKPEPNS